MRRLLIILSIFLLAAILANWALWSWAENQLTAGTERALAQAAAEGWVVHAEFGPRGGWPLAATRRLTNVRADNAAMDIHWRVPALRLRLSLTDPGAVELFPLGEQNLRIGASPDLTYQAQRFSVQIPVNQGGTADLLSKDMQLDLPASIGGIALGGGALHLAEVTAHADWRSGLAISLRVQALALSPGKDWALGPNLSSLAVDTVISPALPEGSDLPRQLQGWRAENGQIQIQHLALGWGPLGLSGTATLGLDGDLRPNGKAALRILGAADTLDALSSHGSMTPSQAAAAKGIVMLLQQTPPGGVPAVELPLQLNAGTLSAAGIPFARLPEPSWN